MITLPQISEAKFEEMKVIWKAEYVPFQALNTI